MECDSHKEMDVIVNTVTSMDNDNIECNEERSAEEQEGKDMRFPVQESRNPDPQHNQTFCDEVIIEEKDTESKHDLFSVEDTKSMGVECNQSEAHPLVMSTKKSHEHHNNKCAFSQKHSHHKGIKMFGEKGKQAAVEELKQWHTRKCFAPISAEVLSQVECDRAQQALMCLAKKHNRTTKGRMVCNVKSTREWSNKEESSSPTVTLEGFLST